MTESTPRTLYLVDGTALMYRAFFAFMKNPLINSKGEDTSAAFGVTNTLLALIRDRRPDALAVAFDTGKPTFRHEMYDQYKATRQKMPGELIAQVDRVKEAIGALGIPLVEMDGFEADDIIGTLVLRGAETGHEVYMVTGDKDFMQLVRPGISMYVPMKNEIVTPAGVEEKYGVPPARVIDLMGLMGDSSDNVPGVPKVGGKTAAALLQQFDTFDDIFDRADEITKPSIRESVKAHRDQAYLSRELVTIKTDVPVDLSPGTLRFDGIDTARAREFFREMEFTSLMDNLGGEEQTYQPSTVEAVTVATLDDFLGTLEDCTEFAIDTETTDIDPMRADLVGISAAACGRVWYLPVAHQTGVNVPREAFTSRLNAILADPAHKKIGHNAKYDAVVLKRAGFTPAPFAFDTMIAAYMLDPSSRVYSLEKLAGDQLGRRMQSITELIGKGKNQRSFAEVSIPDATAYSGDDADITRRLKDLFAPRLANEGVETLFTDVEMPLMHVLMDMEMHGVMLDVPFLGEMSETLADGMASYEKRIYEAAGETFNINSPKQLADILFEKIGLKPVRKTKTGYSTDIDVLTRLARQHELPDLILQYRQVTKLKSTYVDALPAMINPGTGRIHTSFNQTVAVTGRLSSSDPNLQNIPVRTEQGREIRKAFIAPPGHVLLSADYSQIELRIMAHISGDPVLTRAFREGADVHARTASVLFGADPANVSPDQRRHAKTINFGVMYGMGAYALSEQLGISRAEAKDYIDNYFATHTGVKAYMDRTIAEAEKNGYVTTLRGRRRYVPDITSSNHNVAEFNKRTAINTPIQGSAADLIKISMINLARRLEEEGLAAAMILQVHDELVLEVPEAERDRAAELVRECMEGAMDLDVPLVVDMGFGANWLEAH